MNIFVLDNNPTIAAEYHTDKHVVKMILESAQMLSTAHHISGTNETLKEMIYKPAYANHPCTVWARQSSSNYFWLFELFKSLLLEYNRRYGKEHSSNIMTWLLRDKPSNIPDGPLTPFAQAMPDQYKDSNAVIAYHKYYNNEKKHLFKWSTRPTPSFIQAT
jgi:hypothetical protein